MLVDWLVDRHDCDITQNYQSRAFKRLVNTYTHSHTRTHVHKHTRTHARAYKTRNCVFPGKKDESCYKDLHCQFPLMCINNKCNCPPHTRYASAVELAGTYPVSRCIPDDSKFSFANPHGGNDSMNSRPGQHLQFGSFHYHYSLSFYMS